ncbi:S9 family peptidase [Singulisphaera acidiphila]|uniref:Dipeptidyl aminopeptidase/acylaminoacyl peptidase n=1 Tax=Singulisphaera acidiphila (strain ATCC BAA-1392 / DSM 18658 / VKM B-2454 / MOB10) TaxID=886293 RepID=L0DQA9_SINAD|nr:prolyl oligopeptidase family serine peptidase [Singulisphaera acidiphila]AGA31073.1 dipeptidyl aminopeptidase/acylaminoacyl peptidase [Singulisphaera acidiphila DSM 18658]
MRLSMILACPALIAITATVGFSQSVPDSIIAEGVPEVPRALAESLSRYQNHRTALFQGWFADRREVLITTRFADTNQVHLVTTPGGARTQQTFLADRVLGASARPRHEQFLFEADQGGAENYQLFLDDPKEGSHKRLSDGRSRHVSARWSNSGNQLAWSSNARNSKDMDLYIVDPASPQSARRLKEVDGDWMVADWAPDDQRVAAVEYRSINESYVYLIDVKTGETEAITPKASDEAPAVSYADVRWSKDGKALYWTSDRDSEFRRLTRYDLATRTATTLTAEIPWGVDGFDLSDDGATIVLATNENGISRIHILDVASGGELPGPALPAGQVGGIQFRRHSREFAYSLTSARATTDVYSFDLDGGTSSRWTASETGGLNPKSFAEPELIHYPSFDGLSIPAFVYRPSATRFPGPRPVLIDIHGGPEGQFRPGFLGRTNYLIEELGITLVFPNVRGSAGYGKSYLKLDNGPKREDSVKDIGALLDWIAKQPGLDASRVGVIGVSYGGFMALATLTHYSDRLKGGIDIVGISNFISFLENTRGYRRDLRRAEYGDERDPAIKAIFEAISPLMNADKIKVPLLVAQGKNDPRVPASESEQIVARVRRGGQPVWSILAKDEGHGFAKKKNQDYLQEVEVLFLKTYLLGDRP